MHKNGVITTKRKLWKRPSLVLHIVNSLKSRGYQFKEVVYGAPNDFVFADTYDEIETTLKRKGFFGIRIRFTKGTSELEIASNTNGVDNVKYDIFADEEISLEAILLDIPYIAELIGTSSKLLIQSSEYMESRKKLRIAIIVLILLPIVYFLGVHVFLLRIFSYVLGFSPFLLFYIIFILLRRR